MMPAAGADVMRPLASLRSKCEKALARVAPGTWQHARLREDVAALRIACALVSGTQPPGATTADLQAAQRRLASMAAIARKAKAGFEAGTSQHTLQRNRLAALRAARRDVDRVLRQARASADVPDPAS